MTSEAKPSVSGSQDGAGVPGAAFTPGPWKVFYGTEVRKILGVGEVTGEGVAALWRDGAEEEANAHLIAAAPEMYDLLNEAANLIEGDLTGAEWMKACAAFLERAHATLASAQGAQQ